MDFRMLRVPNISNGESSIQIHRITYNANINDINMWILLTLHEFIPSNV